MQVAPCSSVQHLGVQRFLWLVIMRSHHAGNGAYWCRVAVLLLTLCLMNKCSAITFEEFIGYPFDEANGYTVFPRELNLVRGLPIPVPFPFFGRTFSYVHIEDSGYISLINVNSSVNTSDIATLLQSTPYTPRDFPLNSSNTILSGIDWGAVIAPYWYDVDTRGNGSGRIYYKDVTGDTGADLIAEIDSLAAPHLCGFTTTWALIVTWDHVGYYERQSDKPNTFQVVIATDGMRSMAVFNYAEDGIDEAGGGALAGYNVGDGVRHFELPGSLSEDIQYIDNTTGNTGRQGQWVLLLEDTVPCNFKCCKKKKNAICTKVNAVGNCTDQMTSCSACYFAQAERPLPSQCSTAHKRYRCAGLTGRKKNRCLRRWGKCVRKAFKPMNKQTPKRLRKAKYFKCPEYPCNG